ncbi:MAG: endonuclease/exonuclease/phosphatase family protein [Phycisphaerales bacterium]
MGHLLTVLAPASTALSAGVLLAVLGLAQPPAAPSAPPQPPKEPAAPTPGVRLFGTDKPTPRTPGAIRLATYNIENLFDAVDDPALSGEHEDAKALKPDADCKNVANAIKAIDADVLAVQEIESLASLTWFRDTYLKDLGYTHIVSIDAGDERGIEQGVLSRFPLKDVKNWIKEPLGGTHGEKFGNEKNRYAGEPITFHRSPLRVTVTVEPTLPGMTKPYDLTMFVIHYKSGGPGNYWRVKEAAKTVELVKAFEKESPGANIVVLGDFNASPSEKPMDALREGGLVSLSDNHPPSDPLIISHTSGRLIDHIFHNTAVAGEFVKGSMFVLGTMTRPKGVDYRTTPTPAGWASDHYPVVVDIKPID